MKKLMYLAAALLVLVACDNQGNNAPERTPFKKGQQVTLTVGSANQGNQAPARTMSGARNDDNIAFTWEDGDKILVKVGQESAVFTLSSEPGKNEGEFTGVMPAAGSTFDIQYPIVAPDLSAQVYTTEKPIPADSMLFGATECTLDAEATLTAQYAMVQLNLFGTDKTVGKIVFTNKTANPAVSYTLTCTGGKTIAATSTEATPFYMVVPTGTYQFEAEIWDNATTSAKICSFATSAAKTFTAGKCLNMPAKEVALPIHNGHAYVDLGLPSGLKWATCNVGATKPEEYGDYFAYGETAPYYNKPITNPITWKNGKTTGYDWQSYCGASDLTEWSTAPYDDNKILKPEYDAATANWGGNWRMPTKAEQDELQNNCTWTWTTLNSISGYEVKGPNKNTIFLPASGYYKGSSLIDDVISGIYWSSSVYSNGSRTAYDLTFFQGRSVSFFNDNRYFGQSVRPVVD